MNRCETCHCSPCRCDMFAEGRPPGLAGNTSSAWPQKSDAMACHPSQIPAMLERNKRHGVTGVGYDPEDGRAILSDRAARRDLMALEGYHDNNGGFGDDHAGESPLPVIEGPALTDTAGD
jgi:hypothetical protein